MRKVKVIGMNIVRICSVVGLAEKRRNDITLATLYAETENL